MQRKAASTWQWSATSTEGSFRDGSERCGTGQVVTADGAGGARGAGAGSETAGRTTDRRPGAEPQLRWIAQKWVFKIIDL